MKNFSLSLCCIALLAACEKHSVNYVCTCHEDSDSINRKYYASEGYKNIPEAEANARCAQFTANWKRDNADSIKNYKCGLGQFKDE